MRQRYSLTIRSATRWRPPQSAHGGSGVPILGTAALKYSRAHCSQRTTAMTMGAPGDASADPTPHGVAPTGLTWRHRATGSVPQRTRRLEGISWTIGVSMPTGSRRPAAPSFAQATAEVSSVRH